MHDAVACLVSSGNPWRPARRGRATATAGALVLALNALLAGPRLESNEHVANGVAVVCPGLEDLSYCRTHA